MHRVKLSALACVLACVASQEIVFAQPQGAVKLPFGVIVPAERLNSFLADTANSVVIVKARKPDADKPVLGAGFVIAAIPGGGYVAICRHVIAGAESVSVAFPGGLPFQGSIDFEDRENDLAVLRIVTDRKLNPILLCRALPQQGDEVSAIGHPHGYMYTYSRGHISGLGREVELSATTLKTAIQHTAAISVGNSGGPLLDKKWDAVGINTAYHSGGQNIGFAVDCVTMCRVLEKRYLLPVRAAVVEAAAPVLKSAVKPRKIKPMSYAHPEPMTRADD